MNPLFPYQGFFFSNADKVDWTHDRLGVDTFVDDPLTQFKITMEAYPEMGKLVASLKKRTVFVMEGYVFFSQVSLLLYVDLVELTENGCERSLRGYCLPAIGGCVRGVLDGFLESIAANPEY